MLDKVLVATDGSEPAENAIKYILENAPQEAELIVVTVTNKSKDREDISRVFQHGESDKLYSKKVIEKSELMVSKFRPDIKGTYIIKEGNVADIITDTADEENVNIIIMGSRGLGGVSGFMLGSTSREVVNQCRKPILKLK